MSDFKLYSGILVKYKNRGLFCKRSKENTLPNEWSIPSGQVENNETPKQAAVRELYEETSIRIKEKDIEFVDILNLYNTTKTNKRGLMYIFLYESNKIILPNLDLAKDGFEHEECQYLDVEDVPFTKKTEEMKKIVKKYL
jgi:ADP-ribose pyrophosphatase YjhB (NUDIX family)